MPLTKNTELLTPCNIRISVAAQSKERVCGGSLAATEGSNPIGFSYAFLSILCCQVHVSSSGRSLIQSSPTECGVSMFLKPEYCGSPGQKGVVAA